MAIFSADDINKALNWCYSKAISDIPGLGSARDIAKAYDDPKRSVHDNADRLIRWQCAKTGTAGFMTGVLGFVGALATVPADLGQSFYVWLRMGAAIAYLGGHDAHSDQVKTMCLLCLCGNRATEVIKRCGIDLGKRVALNAIKAIPGKVLIEINKKVRFRLFTKFGEKGVINLGKLIPLVGGFIGGTVNIASTFTVGKTAKKMFLDNVSEASQ